MLGLIQKNAQLTVDYFFEVIFKQIIKRTTILNLNLIEIKILDFSKYFTKKNFSYASYQVPFSKYILSNPLVNINMFHFIFFSH